MKRLTTTFFALITVLAFSSEPDVDYHVVNAFYTDGNKLEIELDSSFDGLDLQKVVMQAKAKTLAQANLIVNGITIERKLIDNGTVKQYIFDTAANAITFGHNLDTIEVETHGAIAIEQFAIQAR